jgi:DNA mismatch repair protein MutS
MLVDEVTLKDLSIFCAKEEESIFHLFNHTQSSGGKYFLHKIFNNPLPSLAAIEDMQQTLQFFIKEEAAFNSIHINNGTLMVMEKFFETPLSNYPVTSNTVNSFFYTLFYKSDYLLTDYSLTHFHIFLKEIKKIANLLQHCYTTKAKKWQESISTFCSYTWIEVFCKNVNTKNISQQATLQFAKEIKDNFKHPCLALISIFYEIDAHLSIVKTTKKIPLSFPTFIGNNKPTINAVGLYHPLVNNAVSYDILLNEEENFVFLTGANMAGKSTFIKALGVAVYLANIGLPTPTKKLALSKLDGLLSNINIIDNIYKNESYFYNEVKRIKNTIEILNNNNTWLILVDELFKGTNIEDAMKCSTTVIEGLQSKKNALFVLSTHLYEIANELKKHKNIQFKYFNTAIVKNSLQFDYVLKDGVSKDKLGYLILENEGIVKLLQR